MEMEKTLRRDREMLRRNVNMAVGFGRLAVEAGTAPGSNVLG